MKKTPKDLTRLLRKVKHHNLLRQRDGNAAEVVPTKDRSKSRIPKNKAGFKVRKK